MDGSPSPPTVGAEALSPAGTYGAGSLKTPSGVDDHYVVKSLRRLPLGLCLVVPLAACGSSAKTPQLSLPSTPATAFSLAGAYGASLPRVTWPGGWRFSRVSAPSSESERQAATFTLGSEGATRILNIDGFQSFVGIDFAILPKVDGDPGEGGIGILQFKSAQGARSFYRLWQGSSGHHIPGVVVGNYDGQDEPSTCPPQCGDGGFVLAVRDFVIEGGLNCEFSSGCTGLAEEFGESVYRGILLSR